MSPNNRICSVSDLPGKHPPSRRLRWIGAGIRSPRPISTPKSPVRNGPVSTSVRLACALCYFAGGSPYDIMAKYGLSHASMYESIWTVVEAVNTFDEFGIEYPASEIAQLKIAEEFEKVSEVKFNNCAGAIDGILIWILKPSVEDANDAGCGQRKFFGGRKGKFGFNCQAVSDIRGRILDLLIELPGASLDCIAFEGSCLYERLEGGFFLKNGLVLYGDNAYINTRYMATPFPNLSSGSKDDYIFFSLSCASMSSAPLDNWSAGGEF